MNKKKAVGNAIGKIILIGEHSVVYGEPALAIPFSGVHMETIITSSDTETMLDCFEYSGLLYAAPENYFGLTSLIKKVVEDLNKDLINFDITINSSIPVERGMGSSAAVAAATVRALYNYFDEDLDDETLSNYVNFSEKIVHGNPSGIDTAIVVYEKPLYYIKNKTLEHNDFDLDAYLLVADTGELGMTKFAVSKVRELYDSNDEAKQRVAQLGVLVNNVREYLNKGDTKCLALAMNEAQTHLDYLGVSNDTIDHLVSTAQDNGALAAKLTGGGLGGCVIVLCASKADAEKVASELKAKGAKQTWTMNMKKGDHHAR